MSCNPLKRTRATTRRSSEMGGTSRTTATVEAIETRRRLLDAMCQSSHCSAPMHKRRQLRRLGRKQPSKLVTARMIATAAHHPGPPMCWLRSMCSVSEHAKLLANRARKGRTKLSRAASCCAGHSFCQEACLTVKRREEQTRLIACWRKSGCWDAAGRGSRAVWSRGTHA
jgi:hypothetical protein